MPPKTQLMNIGVMFHVYAEGITGGSGGTILPPDLDPTTTNWRQWLPEETEPEDSAEAYFVRSDTPGKTRYLLITGPGTAFDFESDRLVSLIDVETDRRPSAFFPLVVVVGPDAAVPWDQPGDFVLDPENPRQGLGIPEGPIHVLVADGTVREIPADVEDEVLAAYLQCLLPVPPELEAKFNETFGAGIKQVWLED